MRVHWEDVPNDVRAALEKRMGARVVEAVTQAQGFSPGVAARLRLDDGRRIFLKAVSERANPDTHDIHRREAHILAALPANIPAPKLLWTYDGRGWVALGLEDIDGRHPHEPWTEPDLELVVAAATRMTRELTPSPITVGRTASDAFKTEIRGWAVAQERNEEGIGAWARRNLARLAALEERAPEAASGDTLLQFDMRADNILIRDDRVYFVDWPWARTGAGWIDLVLMAPSVAMQGGPAPEEFLQRLDLGGVAREALDAVICSIGGYFVVHALDPPPPGIPTVRAFQAAQGRVAEAWLRERLGWD